MRRSFSQSIYSIFLCSTQYQYAKANTKMNNTYNTTVAANLGACISILKQWLIYFKQGLTTSICCGITNSTKEFYTLNKEKPCCECKRYLMFKFDYRPIPPLFIFGGLWGCEAWFCAFRRSLQRPSCGPQQPCWTPEQPLWTAQQGALRQE